MRYLFSLWMVALLFAACTNEPSTDNEAEGNDTTGKGAMSDADYQNMAQELCDCLQPVLQLTKDLQQKEQEGDEAGMAALLENLESIMNTSSSCVDGVDQKYHVTTEEQQRKATEAMEKSCPEIMAMLNALQ